MQIRRDKQDMSLDVVIPDNRLGLFDQEFFGHDAHKNIITRVIAE